MIGYYEFKQYFNIPLEEGVLEEGVTGTWEYKPPKDKEQLLYDFYMLLFVVPHGEPQGRKRTSDPTTANLEISHKLDFVIRETESIVLQKNKENLLKATFFSICAEMRHLFDAVHSGSIMEISNMVRKEFGEKKAKKFLNWASEFTAWQEGGHVATSGLSEPKRGRRSYMKQGHDSYVSAYKAALNNFDKDEFVDLAIWAFGDLSWRSQYGGKAWLGIAEGWKHLKNAKDKKHLYVYIDHIYDLQHNTGTVFNKVPTFKKDGGYGWLKRALDHKRDIIDSHELWNHVSPKMRTLAGYALKAIYGKSWETYREEQAKNGKKIKQPYESGNAASITAQDFSASIPAQPHPSQPSPGVKIDTEGLKKAILKLSEKEGNKLELPIKPQDENQELGLISFMKHWGVYVGYFLRWHHSFGQASTISEVLEQMFPDVHTPGFKAKSKLQNASETMLYQGEAKHKEKINELVDLIDKMEPDRDWFAFNIPGFRTYLNKTYITTGRSNADTWSKAHSWTAEKILFALREKHGQKNSVVLSNGIKLGKSTMEEIKKEVEKRIGASKDFRMPMVGAIIFRIYGVHKHSSFTELYQKLYNKKDKWEPNDTNSAEALIKRWAKKINNETLIPEISRNPKLYEKWSAKTLTVSDLDNFISAKYVNSKTFPSAMSFPFKIVVLEELMEARIAPKFDLSIKSSLTSQDHLMHVGKRTIDRLKSIYKTTPNEHGYVATGVALLKSVDLKSPQLFAAMRQILGEETSRYENGQVWQQINAEVWDKAQDEVASFVWPHFQQNPTMAAKLKGRMLNVENIVDIYHGLISHHYGTIILDILKKYAKSQR